LPLASITNGTLKDLVTNMSAAGLSAKTIINYSQLVKLVVASAVDEKTGEPLFPRKWNHDFVDMPVLGKQHQPTVGSELGIEVWIGDAAKIQTRVCKQKTDRQAAR
jgi:hypothetical protein